jgi:hypothetical protein
MHVVAEQCLSAESPRSTSSALSAVRDRVLRLARALSWRSLLILLKPLHDQPHLPHQQDHPLILDTNAPQNLLLPPSLPPKLPTQWHPPSKPPSSASCTALVCLAIARRAEDLAFVTREHQFDFAEVNELAFEHRGAETGDAFVQLYCEHIRQTFAYEWEADD